MPNYAPQIGTALGAAVGSFIPGVGTIIGGEVGGLIGGLFGTNQSNPYGFMKGIGDQYQQQANSWLDTNNPFYTAARQSYFGDLSKTLNETSPTTNTLLAAQTAKGGQYGGASYIANQQAQAQMGRNTDAALRGANQFSSGLYSQGLNEYNVNTNAALQSYNMYGQGAGQQINDQNSFANQFIGLTGGLLGRQYSNMGSGSDSGVPGWNNNPFGGHQWINMGGNNG